MVAGAKATYIKDLGFRTCWTVAPDYAYGHQVAENTLARLEEFNLGIKLLGQSWPPLSEKDFSAYIAQIISAKPDVLFLDIFGGQLLSFIKQAKGYGLYEKMETFQDSQPEQIRPFGMDMQEGVMGWTTYDITAPKSAANDAWVKLYQKKWGNDAFPSYASTEYYSAMLAIKAAMEAAGTTTDREKVVDKLETIKFQAPVGKVYFRALDHQIAWPMHPGRTVFLPGYNFAVVGKDVKMIPAENIWRSEEQVKAARAKKK
jgi:branched-chain amino acid transport system substrate-binding protein